MPRATFPPIEDVAAFDLLYTSNDGVAIVDCQNRLWVHYSPGWSFADAESMATIIRDGWNTHVAPLVQTEYVLHTIRAKNWDNVANPVWDFDVTDAPGTAVGDPIPFTSAAIVRYFTEGTDPTKCYIRHGGIVESQVDGMHLSVAAQGAIRTAWDEVLQDINAVLGANQVCVSPYQPDPTPPNIFKDAGTFEDIGSVVVRRRLGRAASRQG